MRFFLISIVAFLIISAFAPLKANARAARGFNEGPYLQIIGGMMNISYDKNVFRNEKIGYDYEGCYGFSFGWYVYDFFAPELQIRYATTKTGGGREHVVNVNLNMKYSLIFDKLTKQDINKLHIMPFLSLGGMAQISAIPGDAASGDQALSVFSPGISLSGGVDFMYFKYVYLGIQLQGDFVHVPNEAQNINGTMQRIIQGGWDPQLGVLGKAGVHF